MIPPKIRYAKLVQNFHVSSAPSKLTDINSRAPFTGFNRLTTSQKVPFNISKEYNIVGTIRTNANVMTLINSLVKSLVVYDKQIPITVWTAVEITTAIVIRRKLILIFMFRIKFRFIFKFWFLDIGFWILFSNNYFKKNLINE